MNDNYKKLEDDNNEPINNVSIYKDNHDNEKECPICFENIKKYSHLEFDVCKHSYHIHCLNKWKEKKNDLVSDSYICEECQLRREVDNFTIIDKFHFEDEEMQQNDNNNNLKSKKSKKSKGYKIIRCLCYCFGL